MRTIDSFFRAHYRRICNYCACFGFNAWDLEEEISDLIYLLYEDHKQEGLSDQTISRYISRRGMLNLKARYRSRVSYTRNVRLSFEIESDLHHLDDPLEILSLKQRLPQIPSILITYAAHKGAESARGENKNADRTKFCRARKTFLAQLSME